LPRNAGFGFCAKSRGSSRDLRTLMSFSMIQQRSRQSMGNHRKTLSESRTVVDVETADRDAASLGCLTGLVGSRDSAGMAWSRCNGTIKRVLASPRTLRTKRWRLGRARGPRIKVRKKYDFSYDQREKELRK
jgi:hypothetical protein